MCVEKKEYITKKDLINLLTNVMNNDNVDDINEDTTNNEYDTKMDLFPMEREIEQIKQRQHSTLSLFNYVPDSIEYIIADYLIIIPKRIVKNEYSMKKIIDLINEAIDYRKRLLYGDLRKAEQYLHAQIVILLSYDLIFIYAHQFSWVENRYISSQQLSRVNAIHSYLIECKIPYVIGLQHAIMNSVISINDSVGGMMQVVGISKKKRSEDYPYDYPLCHLRLLIQVDDLNSSSIYARLFQCFYQLNPNITQENEYIYDISEEHQVIFDFKWIEVYYAPYHRFFIQEAQVTNEELNILRSFIYFIPFI